MYGIGTTLDNSYGDFPTDANGNIIPSPNEVALTSVDVSYLGPVRPGSPPAAPFEFEKWLAENKYAVYGVAGTLLVLALVKGRR